jgi:hypothetical protein
LTHEIVPFILKLQKCSALSIFTPKEEGVGLMNRNGIKSYLLILVVCLSTLLPVRAWAADPYLTSSPLLTNQELDNLLAPIALYPDPLLAQILPASTYPGEITDAYNWLNAGGTLSGIDGQNWDESVKAIAHYPDILKMMAENGDWTADLGDAFLNQPEDVAGSIQRLRRQARDAGNLQSTGKQTVVIDEGYIEITPAQPQYIYVPVYDPSVIYVQRWYPGRPPFMTFGLGLAIGGWLTMDFDWRYRHIIYHGWNRPGWVNHARPYVQVRNVYINRSRPYIYQSWRHDISRGNPESFRASHPGSRPGNVGRNAPLAEIRGRAPTPPKPPTGVFGPRGNAASFGNRGKESRGIGTTPQKTLPQAGVSRQAAPRTPALSPQPAPPAPSISKQPAPRTPDISRQPAPRPPAVSPQPARPARESIQPPGTPSVTFGGYRGAGEARGQSLRGQASRRSSEGAQPLAAPAAKSSAPERKDSPRGNAPAGRDDSRGKMRR